MVKRKYNGFEMRCVWRGINVNVSNISIGDKFDAEAYDIIFWAAVRIMNRK